jgi:gluconolactonase
VSDVETVVTGLGLLEGPVWRENTGDLVVTVVGQGVLLRVDLDARKAHHFAETKGGPNGAYPSQDGGVLVTQNGGMDWDAVRETVGIVNLNPSVPTTPGIQQVRPDGSVHFLTTPADGPFRAPNDLCITEDQTIWFTDPPQAPPPTDPVGRVWCWPAGERPAPFADGFSYCNGIGVDPNGNILVVEERGLMYLHPDGDRSWLVESLPNGGDGFAFDVDGNVYVAAGRAVTVVSPEGAVVEQLHAPEGPAMLTNCCFGNPDLLTLFVTDGASGRLLAFSDMPIQGVQLALASW